MKTVLGMTPYYAKPGWADRYRVREALTFAAEFVVFVTLILGLPALLWLLAPEGAAYPR